MTNFEFESKDLQNLMQKIHTESACLISEIIEKHSPIQIGENVETLYYEGEKKMLRVTEVTLWAVDLWGGPGCELSFSYYGVPLKRNGEPMKNRNPIWFSSFIKNGKKYHMPSYSRVKIRSARMY